jgi:hypothetical protein
MQNKNNAQIYKRCLCKTIQSFVPLLYIRFCRLWPRLRFSIAFRHETNLSCCTVFWTSKEEIKMKTRFTMFLIESSDKSGDDRNTKEPPNWRIIPVNAALHLYFSL